MRDGVRVCLRRRGLNRCLGRLPRKRPQAPPVLAGDYLATATVDGALAAGLQAADCLLASAAP
jgi:hypothetical protein